jgi:hypothetical protein
MPTAMMPKKMAWVLKSRQLKKQQWVEAVSATRK